MAGSPSERPQKHVSGNPAGCYHGIVAAESSDEVTKGKNNEVAMVVAMAATATEVYVYKLHKSITRHFWKICLSELNNLVHWCPKVTCKAKSVVTSAHLASRCGFIGFIL